MTAMANEELRQKAKVERDRMVRLLTMCECAYPLTLYRNGSGHDVGCPSHAAWLEARR